MIFLSVWILVIAPEYLTQPEFLVLNSQNVGTIQFAENIGDDLSEPVKMIFDWKREIMSKDGNEITIHTTYDYKDIVTDESFWIVEFDEKVDKNTRAYINKPGYFTFPSDLKKQDYHVYDIGGTVMDYKFVGESEIDGLRVYKFQGTEIFDISDAYPEFSEHIWEEYSATNFVEPVTGLEVSFSEMFTDYAIIDGNKEVTLVAEDESTEFSQSVLANKAKDLKSLYLIYNNIIPIIIIILSVIGFYIGILIERISKKKSEVNLLKKVDREKDEFFSIVSHELLTPLMPILTYSNILQKTKLGDLNEKQTKAVNSIEKSALRLENIVSNLLEMIKIKSDKVTYSTKSFNLTEKINHIKDYYTEKFKNIEFSTSVQKDLFMKADEEKIEKIFEKLIQNAVDFVPEIEGKIEMGAKIQDKNMVCYVKDNGSGIAKEKQEMIFKPLYQTDMSITRKHSGLGLGLSICKEWVHGMNGKIWVESKQGSGSIFYFSIPNT